MAIKSMQVPSQDSVDRQLRIAERKAKFRDALLFVLGIALGGVLGFVGLFDPLGNTIMDFYNELLN